jgi:hypothetical protein
MLMNEVRGELFWRKLPESVRNSLSPEQAVAIREAAQVASPRRHPIDVRLSVPLPGQSRIYLVLLAGRELRSGARREMEQRVRPKDRFGQVILVALCIAAFCVAALIGVLLRDAIFAP